MAEKYKRTRFFINRKLQGRYMVSFSIPMFILVFFIGIVMFYSANSVIRSTIIQVGKEIHTKIRSQRMFVTDPAEQNRKIVEQLDEYAALQREGKMKGFYKHIVGSMIRVMLIGLVIVIIELGLLSIFVSHKIAGPIFRFEKFAEDLEAGDFNARVRLRGGDQLTDTAEKFNKMADAVQNRITDAKDLMEKAEKDPAGAAEYLKQARELLG